MTPAERSQTSVAPIVDQLEDHMLQLPQAECPVVHHFGPGLYIREVTLPAGILAIGHAQRYEHLNIMLTGAVAMLGDDGQVKVLCAPLIFTGQPGRKTGYVLETTTWLNVYPTDERDVDKIEAMFLDKSPVWQAHADAARQAAHASHEDDRADFFKLIGQAGFAPETVREQSENKDDQIEMPDGHGLKVTIRPSPIEGLGVFLSAPAEAEEVIAPARIAGFRTPVGRYTNHSKTPNARFVLADNGTIYLVANRRIAGCCGGDQGEEVTVDYRQALALSGIYLKGE